jgi:hypothetical protein
VHTSDEVERWKEGDEASPLCLILGEESRGGESRPECSCLKKVNTLLAQGPAAPSVIRSGGNPHRRRSQLRF